MENFKGTPGPWFVYDSTSKHPKKEGQHTGTFDIINREQYEAGMKVIADAKPYGGNFPEHEEARANAKLIAAAPDLFDALKELLECDYTSGTHLYAAQLRAKEAILKATK